MRVLIVGAGQVGVVFANHLLRGGAEVSFLVKPKHAAQTAKGLTLYELKMGRRHPPAQRLDAVPVLTTWAEAAQSKWDWVMLAIPSPGLREPGFVEGLQQLAPGTRIVALVLGLGDLEWLEQTLGRERLYRGEINMLSFAAPLGSLQPATPGTAYFFPPGSKLGLWGPDPAALSELTALSTRGGMAAGALRGRGSRLPPAVLFALISALEAVGWKFANFSGSDALGLGLAATREREAMLELRGEGRGPFLLRLFFPLLMRVLLWFAARALPLPLEDFLRVHFQKVGRQFEQDRERLIAEGARRGVPVPALTELHRRLATASGSDRRT